MSDFLNIVRPHRGDKNGNSNKIKYNPQCGVSKEVFEWHCCLQERVSSRSPELMRKMRDLTQRMRTHFQDDEEGLKAWNVYEDNVLYAYERNLQCSLSRPVMTPNSVLYKDLMKRQAYFKTLAMISEAFHKFKHRTKGLRLVIASSIAVGAAAGLAVGLAVGWRQQKT